MDKQKIIKMAASILAAVETVTVAGEHNRTQLSGIYRTANAIISEAGRGDDNG